MFVRVYDQLYVPLPLKNKADRYLCYYCGEPCDCLDHQPPISVIDKMVTAKIKFEAFKIPSCNHCNNILHSVATKTVKERFDLLKKRLYKKRYKEIIATTQWTDEELSELGANLRQMVESSIRLGIVAVRRIEYPGHDLVEIYESHGVKCVRCTSCDADIPVGDDFCPECGN